MKINELEKRLGLSKANIRYYEDEGLLSPKRAENGYRDYTEDDVRLLKKIIVYRKLGIPISEIKAVLNDVVSLNETVKKSVVDMQANIKTQKIIIDICNEIIENDVADTDFDTDYFWNKIESREIKGNEFVDIGNIDITHFKNKKTTKALVIVSASLFFLGIIYAFICNFFFVTHNNEEYKITLPLVETSDTIDTVKVDSANELIYVCYSEAGCVNTYDFDGRFKWAVSVPRLEGKGYTYFYLIDNKIYIDNENEVYVYNSLTGEYIEKNYADEIGLIDKRDDFDSNQQKDINRAKEFGITFDLFNAYIKTGDNRQVAFVSKPISIMLLNDSFGCLISFISGLGLAAIAFVGRVKTVNSIVTKNEEISKKAKRHKLFNLILTAIFMIFTITNLICSVFGFADIKLGIFPLTALFIVSCIVGDITKEHYNKAEYKYNATVFHYLVLSYVGLLIVFMISLFFS